MSVNIYARQAPLSDACGRADYISSDHRQENLMATATTITMPEYWQLLSADCQTAFRQSGGKKTKADGIELKACEAREIHVQLPNSALDRLQADQLAEKIANDFRSQYGADCLVAIHYNKSKSNLHCHIMFSERQLLPDPEIKIADRNVFLDANGIRKRTKKEILDADGQLLPGCSIVKKGEILSARYFGDKNPMFAEKSWMNEYRHHMATWINTNLQPDELRTVYDPKGPYLAQKHIGKGTPLAKVQELEEWNGLTKDFRALVDCGYVSIQEAKEFKTRISLSPDQNQELKAVLAEIYREMEPDHPQYRDGWDRVAAKSAATPLAPDIPDREEKQALRELYKEQGELRIRSIESDSDVEQQILEAKILRNADAIKKKKENLGISEEQQMIREFGRLAGFKRNEIDRIYKTAPKLSKEEWAEIWQQCKGLQAGFWDDYRKRSEAIAEDLTAAYARRRRIKEAEWLLSPKNGRTSLLGALYALIIIILNGDRQSVEREIYRLKVEQTALRRSMQIFRAASGETVETLKTKNLDLQKYLDAITHLQEIATLAETMSMNADRQRNKRYEIQK